MTTDTDIIALIMTTSTQYHSIRAWNHICVIFSIEKGLDPWSMYLDDIQQLNKASCLIYFTETGTGRDTLQVPDWKFDDRTYHIRYTQNKNLFKNNVLCLCLKQEDDVVVGLYTWIWEIPDMYVSQLLVIMTQVFHGFLESFHPAAGKVSWNRVWLPLLTHT